MTAIKTATGRTSARETKKKKIVVTVTAVSTVYNTMSHHVQKQGEENKKQLEKERKLQDD